MIEAIPRPCSMTEGAVPNEKLVLVLMDTQRMYRTCKCCNGKMEFLKAKKRKEIVWVGEGGGLEDDLIDFK